MRNIYSKLRKAVVYGNARTGDSIFGNLGLGSVLISVIILFSLRSGLFLGLVAAKARASLQASGAVLLKFRSFSCGVML